MNFSNSLEIWWNVLKDPTKATFLPEGESTDIGTAFIWMGLAALVSGLFGAVNSVISGFLFSSPAFLGPLLQDADLPPQLMEIMAASGSSVLINAGVTFGLTVVFVPLGFLLVCVIYFGTAKLFGSEASFEAQAYAIAAFQAPVLIITSVVGILPLISACVTLPLSIYQFALTYEAIKAVNDLKAPATVVVMMTPIVLFFVCICGPLFFVFMALFGSALLAM